jgi:hypothetical protein
MFTGYETPGVCAAKAWDSPRSGTVPVLLISALKLAPFGQTRKNSNIPTRNLSSFDRGYAMLQE